MLDTERMTHGAEVAEELREGADGGIPWSVILGADGVAKVTSDGPKGNIGCPAQPHEIDHFLAMVDATRKHMSDEDRAVLERELRAYGAELVRPLAKEPGGKAYYAARTAVRTGRFADAVAELRESFAAGLSPQLALRDPALRLLREDPERRLELAALVAEHVRSNRVTLVDPLEPGRRIRLDGRVVDRESGEPLAGALVRFFHTDAGGEYRPGMDAGGGAGNPRLFGYVRTDAQGRFTVDTIMPERYPNSTVPRHVHYHVHADGYPKFVSECFFDSDPNLTERTRQTAPERNFPIVELEPGEAGRPVAELIIKVGKG